MAIRKIPTRIITDDAVTNDKIGAGAVDTTELADGAVTLTKTDSLFVNPELSGTEAARMPVGTTAQRASAQSGDIRFNSTTSLMEYYDGTQWKGLDAAPTVSSISPSTIADSDSDVDIVITGTGFSSGATVKAIGQDSSEIAAGTVTVDSATQITANFDGTSFDDAQEDYDIKVISSSGLSGTLDDCLAVNASPAWTVASGSLGNIYDSSRSSLSFTTGATDSESESLTYSVSVGSLPTGLSIDSSTGTITGSTSAVGSDTTTTFTLSVTDGTNTNTRQYSITQLAPVVTSYTSSSGSFSVPSGITAVDVLVVAGGGGGAYANGYSGGGGAGGLIYRPAFPVTPGGTVSYSIGSGGAGGVGPDPGQAGFNGQDSTFGTLTAQGGGGGGKFQGSAIPGGSGGGGACLPNDIAYPGGTGTQPQQPGDSGTYGFGNNGGGTSPWSPAYTARGGGGGGAGAAGGSGSRPVPTSGTSTKGAGGIGKQYDISGTSTYYAGGGGGGFQWPLNPGATGGYGGQGGGGSARNGDSTDGYSTQQGESATANRGGGGGAGTYDGSYSAGGAGGSGIIIIAY